MPTIEQQSPSESDLETQPIMPGLLDQLCWMLGAPIAKLFHTFQDEDDKWDLARAIMRQSPENFLDETADLPSEEGMSDLIEAFEASEDEGNSSHEIAS